MAYPTSYGSHFGNYFGQFRQVSPFPQSARWDEPTHSVIQMEVGVTKSEHLGQRLYKILVGNRPPHGGDYEYDLPTLLADGTYEPGRWTPSVRPELCKSGYHLTIFPFSKWAVEGMTVYEAEGKEGMSRLWHGSQADDDKIAFSQVRLLCPVLPPPGIETAVATIREIRSAIRDAFLKPDGDSDPSWRLFHTEREAQFALSGNPLASGAATDAYHAFLREAEFQRQHLISAGIPPFTQSSSIDAEREARRKFFARDAIGFIPNVSGYTAGAFPAQLVQRVANRLLDGKTIIDVDEREIGIWKKGYGVVGWSNGVPYVYEAY